MARKVGQIVGRSPRTWLVRVYNGRDPGLGGHPKPASRGHLKTGQL